jgi:hypothetical protein
MLRDPDDPINTTGPGYGNFLRYRPRAQATANTSFRPSCYITWNHFFCDVDDTFAVLRRIAKAKLARGRGERYQQAATAQRGIL